MRPRIFIQIFSKLRSLAVSAAKKLPGVKKFAPWLWRAIDIAALGSIFIDLKGSGGSSTSVDDPSTSPIIIATIVSRDTISRYDQVITAFERGGLILSQSSGEDEQTQGIAYLCFAEYMDIFMSRGRTSCESVEDLKKEIKRISKMDLGFLKDPDGSVSIPMNPDDSSKVLEAESVEAALEEAMNDKSFGELINDSNVFVLYDAIIYIKTKIYEAGGYSA